jgi:hypothetical protein
MTPMEGNFSDGQTTFKIEITDNAAISQWGVLNLPLIFDVDGLGYVQYPFLFLNFGNPKISTSANLENMEPNVPRNLTIKNLEGGVFYWSINDCPDWIKISKRRGTLLPGREDILSIEIVPEDLFKGEYQGDISIIGADGQYYDIPISTKITDPIFTRDIFPLDGAVVDADYNKSSDLLVVVTQNPNRFYTFEPNKLPTIINLSETPTCITISNTGQYAIFASSNNTISKVDLATQLITKTASNGMLASDIALGDNGWLYLCPVIYNNSQKFQSFNINTGESFFSETNLEGIENIVRVPNKGLLYGTRIGWGSPNGLCVFDISKGVASDPMYFSQINSEKFWLSESCDKLYFKDGLVFNAPPFVAPSDPLLSNFNAIKILDGISATSKITSIDNCLYTSDLFVSFSSLIFAPPQIHQLNIENYTKKRNLEVKQLYSTENNRIKELVSSVPFMFVNRYGSELNLIIKGTDNRERIYWYYEKIML